MGEHIVLGFGNSIDYEIVWNSRVIEQLIHRYGITSCDLTPEQPVNTLRDLVVSILGFMKNEIGGERFVASPRIIEEFSEFFKRKVTLGGTSARAAIAMRKLGYTAALHLVTVNDWVENQIPRDIPWVCGNEAGSCYPHLIVQFDRGTGVRAGDIAIETKRSNRIIYNNDPDNIAMSLNPEFTSLLSDAEVLLISGFNAMRSGELLEERVNTLLEMMRSLPPGALVFYEDAGFHEQELNLRLRERLKDVIDIYSLNEDELQACLGRRVGLLDPPAVHAALQDLHQIIPVPILVVHTRHWALAYGKGAARYAAALRGGIAMATTRYRFGDDFRAADYSETARLQPDADGKEFSERLSGCLGEMVCCLPALNAEEEKATSVGLGDAFVGGFLPALLREH